MIIGYDKYVKYVVINKNSGECKTFYGKRSLKAFIAVVSECLISYSLFSMFNFIMSIDFLVVL